MKKNSRLINNFKILYELFFLIIKQKKYWLIPLLLVLGFLGLFISFTGNSSILPIIYALF
jgi:hypothetical protein